MDVKTGMRVPLETHASMGSASRENPHYAMTTTHAQPTTAYRQLDAATRHKTIYPAIPIILVQRTESAPIARVYPSEGIAFAVFQTATAMMAFHVPQTAVTTAYAPTRVFLARQTPPAPFHTVRPVPA